MKQILPQDKIRRKLNGYRVSHRNRWLLVTNHVLSLQTLSLFEFYVDIADFDVKHETFGTFICDYQAIATIFDCSISTIRVWHKQLIDKGLVSLTSERNVFEVINLQRYISPGFWKGRASDHSKLEKNQSVENIIQLMKENVSPNIDKMNIPSQVASSRALGSSKNESSNLFGMSEEDVNWVENQFLRSSKSD